MQKPKMVMFDAGKTLLNYLDIDTCRGARGCGMVPVLYKSEFNTYSNIPSDIIAVDDYGQLVQALHDCV